MKKICSFFILASVLLSFSISEARENFPNAKKPTSQLLIESESLKILDETGVQKEDTRSRRTYGLKLARLSADRLSVFANDRAVNYPISNQNAVAADIGYFPLNYYGRWGVLGGIRYTYLEGSGPILTALHWTEGTLSIAYRYEHSARSYVRPFAAFGGGVEVLVQRGPTYYNTSEAQGVRVGTLGANLNLTRVLKLRSPLTWELSASYQRIWAPRETYLDFNGSRFALGLDLAL